MRGRPLRVPLASVLFLFLGLSVGRPAGAQPTPGPSADRLAVDPGATVRLRTFDGHGRGSRTVLVSGVGRFGHVGPSAPARLRSRSTGR